MGTCRPGISDPFTRPEPNIQIAISIVENSPDSASIWLVISGSEAPARTRERSHSHRSVLRSSPLSAEVWQRSPVKIGEPSQGQCVMPVTHHCCTLEYVCGAVALARYRRPSLGVSSLDWAAHYRAAFFSGQATVCSVDDQDIAQFLLREGWAELPIDVTDQA